MAQDWDIKPRGTACHACTTAFQDGQPYYSALVFGEAGYVRADYCSACWPTAAVNATPYSSWNGVFRLPPPPPQEPLKKETAESLLRRLMELEDEAHRNVIFILAVMLERKKLLVEKAVQTREDGLLIRLYEHRKTGDTFLIPDPRLRLEQIAEVQRQVVSMLEGRFPDAPVPGAGETNAPPATDEPATETASPAPPPADAPE